MDQNEESPSTSRSTVGVGVTEDSKSDVLQGEAQGDEDVNDSDYIMSPSQMAKTLVAAMQENSVLKATLNELKMSVILAKFERKDAVAKYKKLKKIMTTKHGMTFSFPMEAEFKRLFQEEMQLKEQEEELTKELNRVIQQNMMKVDQVQALKRRVNKLTRSQKKLDKDNIISNDGDGESKEAIMIFPEEIWMLIFGDLTDWQDLLNCSKACLLFHKKLHPLNATFLFGRVLPHLFQHLSRGNILKCRSVSKKWNLVVDNFLENHPSIRPHDEDKCDPQILQVVNPLKEKQLGSSHVFSVYQTEPTDGLNLWHPKFRTDFGLSSRNPFVGRSVRINLRIDNDGDRERYWSELYHFLETFGKHIWFLSVNINGNLNRTNLRANDRLILIMDSLLNRDIFSLLPHLRSLAVENRLEHFPISEIHSFPSAPNLETLDLDCRLMSSTHHHQSDGALLRNFHSQLQRLHVHFKTWNAEGCQLEWPKLVEFHIRMRQERTDFDGLLQLKATQLQKLVLMTYGFIGAWRCRDGSSTLDEDDCKFEDLLDIVGKISTKTRLTTLRIYGEIGAYENHSEGYSPVTLCKEIPTPLMPIIVKTLELECSPRTCHFFLIRFPCLENLKLFLLGNINWRMTHATKEIVEINKYIVGGGGLDIYRSNMWEVLPCLKLFTLHTLVFTRHEYEMYDKRG